MKNAVVVRFFLRDERVRPLGCVSHPIRRIAMKLGIVALLEAKPGKDLTEVAWVTAEEAKNYDLIEGIAEEIKEVEKIISGRK